MAGCLAPFPSGERTLVHAEHGIRGRDRERVTIGRYPAMKLSDAGTHAKRLLAAEPEDKGVRITFAEARVEFLEDHYRDASPNTEYPVIRRASSSVR